MRSDISAFSLTYYLNHYASRRTKILITVVSDIPIDRSLQSYRNTVNLNSLHSCSFHYCLKPGRLHASRQMSELTIVAYRAT